MATRPISAKVLIKKHKNFRLKRGSNAHLTHVETNTGTLEAMEDVHEKSVLSKVTRKEHNHLDHKRSTY